MIDRGTNHYALRLPADLMDRVRERAQQDGRSINAEITWLLGQALNIPRWDAGRMEIQQQIDEAGSVEAWLRQTLDSLGIVTTDGPGGRIPTKGS